MQHVKPSWLRIFNYALICMTAVLFAVSFLFEQLGVSEATKAHWGITSSILIMGAIHAVYVLVIYPFFYKKYTWITNLIPIVIYAFLFAGIIDTSGNTNLIYRLGYAVLVFFMGLNGPFAPMLAVILTWTVLVFSLVGLTTPTKATIGFNLVIDLVVTAAGIAGWYVFKRWYVSGESTKLVSMLEQEQFKSNTIIESISDGVMIVNTKGTVQTLNNSAAAMLGWSREEAIHLDYKTLIQPNQENEKEQAEDAISLSLKNNDAVQKISLLTTQHQHQIYVDIVASPLLSTFENPDTFKLSQKSVGVVAVLRNVDSQKREEQQRSDFISTASHEMRTPVAAIQGFLELALNPKVATVDDKAKVYLEKAYESTKRLGQLFQDLLTVSKTEDGRLKINASVIEVREFLADIVEQEKVSASKKNLLLKFDAHQNIGEKTIKPLMYVNVDADRLREVLLNLVDNAIKYTPSGMITLGASLKDTSVIMRVSDTGMGIAEEDISHLFQKFYRTDNSATREIGGTGLGLYISKQLVEAMGGRIWVESTLGQGSTFYVQIPRVSPENVAQ